MKKRRFWKSEKGAVSIVEATFVFPMAFFIIFFMIMAGEVYYQHAKVEYAVTAAAINGAARCENPMLEKVFKDKAVPTSPKAVEVMPYRYIFTGEAKSIAKKLQSQLQAEVSAFEPLFFEFMAPKHVTVKTDLTMNPIVSSLLVTCSYDISFPIRLIFTNDNIGLHYDVCITASIGDPSELLRNISLVTDSLEMSETASGFGSKVKSGLEAIGGWVN